MSAKIILKAKKSGDNYCSFLQHQEAEGDDDDFSAMPLHSTSPIEANVSATLVRSKPASLMVIYSPICQIRQCLIININNG